MKKIGLITSGGDGNVINLRKIKREALNYFSLGLLFLAFTNENPDP